MFSFLFLIYRVYLKKKSKKEEKKSLEGFENKPKLL